MSDLENLPIAEIRETFWWEETWLNGQLIERRHLFSIWKRDLISAIHNFYMRQKCRLASWLLSGVADPCPHCRKWIDIGRWKKAFDED